MEKVYGIIRVNSKELGEIPKDEQRFVRAGIKGVLFRIPVQTVYRNSPTAGPTLEERPLLLNYGFIELPIAVAVNREALQLIAKLSRVIHSFVYKVDDGEEEEEEDGTLPSPKLAVEVVEAAEVARLEAIALSTGFKYGVDELTVGDVILLQQYPFKNLAAKILAKGTTTITVQLLESGFRATIMNPMYIQT